MSLTTEWGEWKARFQRRLVCTKTEAYFSTKELEQHWNEARQCQKPECHPVDLFGQPEDLATTYNENYWRGFALRQSVIIPMTAITTFFICLLCYRLGSVFVGAEIANQHYSLGTHLVADSESQKSPPRELRALWQSITTKGPTTPLSAEGYIRSHAILNCSTYSECTADEAFLLVTSWHKQEVRGQTGYSSTKTLSAISTLDQNYKFVRSRTDIKRHFSTSRSIALQICFDLIPWIAASLFLRWTAIAIFEWLSLMAQNLGRYKNLLGQWARGRA